jgi:hypothetical protein
MAKKQTRRSISVSRVTYERLKAFCESNGISMSQFVETRVGDFLGEGEDGATQTAAAMVAAFQGGGAMSGAFETQTQTQPQSARAERPALSPVGTSSPRAGLPTPAPRQVSSFSGHAASSSGSSSGSNGSNIMASSAPSASRPSTSVPLTSAAARFAIEPPPPIIKPRADQPAPPVAPRTADQIFTF